MWQPCQQVVVQVCVCMSMLVCLVRWLVAGSTASSYRGRACTLLMSVSWLAGCVSANDKYVARSFLVVSVRACVCDITRDGALALIAVQQMVVAAALRVKKAPQRRDSRDAAESRCLSIDQTRADTKCASGVFVRRAHAHLARWHFSIRAS